MQNHYNLVYREEEREILPLCREEGIGVIPWSPLARGLLAGNRDVKGNGETLRAQTDEYAKKLYYQGDLQVVERVVELAKRKNVKPTQIALAWLWHQSAITAPIIGASRVSHLEDAAAALDITLSSEEQLYLQELYQPHPILGH
jgi:aryl-alcohol dehydrogenase (NADP+)